MSTIDKPASQLQSTDDALKEPDFSQSHLANHLLELLNMDGQLEHVMVIREAAPLLHCFNFYRLEFLSFETCHCLLNRIHFTEFFCENCQNIDVVDDP